MLLTRGGEAMKFIVVVDFPLEPFSTYLRHGAAAGKIGTA
jgi:hypothetical protein